MNGQIKSHMTLAIVSFIFSWPFGIAAIIYASKVKSSLVSGDIVGAGRASKTVKVLSIISIILGILSIIAIFSIASFGAAKRHAQEESGLSISSPVVSEESESLEVVEEESAGKGAIKVGTYIINKTVKSNTENSKTKNISLALEKVVVTEEKMTFYVAITNNEAGEYYTIGAAGLYYSFLKDDKNNQIDIYEEDYSKDVSDELNTSVKVKAGATVRGWVSFPNSEKKSSSYTFVMPLFEEILGITF